MATREQIEFIAEALPKAHPVNFFKVINDSNAGIGFAMKLLHGAEENCLSAGAISEAMGVSTARVAVLLKNMEAKGLITRECDKADARITIVRLSEEGKARATERREKLLTHISDVIDRVGMEKLEQFIALSEEVKAAVEDEFSPEQNAP